MAKLSSFLLDNLDPAYIGQFAFCKPCSCVLDDHQRCRLAPARIESRFRNHTYGFPTLDYDRRMAKEGQVFNTNTHQAVNVEVFGLYG